MTLQDYKLRIEEISFEEFPNFITGTETPLCEIVEYSKADLELKIHLAEVVMGRCFAATGGIYWPSDANWFISSFLNEFQTDIPKPFLSNAIREAIEMILSEHTFSKGVIATTFMLGVIEFYAKHLLGFPLFANTKEEWETQKRFQKVFISDAISKLKKANSELARALNRIDLQSTERLQEIGIQEDYWVKAKISDRLAMFRNPMVHGEAHHFYDKGHYLGMLYILFYLHEVKVQTIAKL